MNGEVTIRAAFVSPELTRAASTMILNEFGGYFRADGFGGHSYADGRTTEESAIAWHIGTDAKDSARFDFLARFALSYCKLGKQESVYMLDVDGAAYLADAGGNIRPLN